MVVVVVRWCSSSICMYIICMSINDWKDLQDPAVKEYEKRQRYCVKLLRCLKFQVPGVSQERLIPTIPCGKFVETSRWRRAQWEEKTLFSPNQLKLNVHPSLHYLCYIHRTARFNGRTQLTYFLSGRRISSLIHIHHSWIVICIVSSLEIVHPC
jgi:hypothetical protein